MPSRLEKSIARERHTLDSAWKLVASEGFLALKISELAKIAGVSIGTL
jgi:AcrR family transcriptional regulator